ncbi:hypothetical protein Taro_021735 [Colocasia esculenta]|uniref:Uncharacterized protein n=1 Tax=Colocasia esculenta TaxID=4460 RepID=A0A843UZR4_COLES|nr:hypothetical protein [Colocasia esculenta]
MSDAAHVKVESDAQSGPLLNSRTSGEALVDLQKKLEELCFSDSEHVIIPDHLQVPEAERCGLSFGSFDASFGIGKRSAFSNDADGEKSTTLPTELSQEHEDNRGEPILSTQVPPSANQEEQYPEHHPETSSQMPDSPSNNEGDNSLNSCVVSDFEQPNEASGVAEGGAQFSVVHTAPAYSAFGLVPPMLGSQLAPFESSESQAREASRVASFITVRKNATLKVLELLLLL